jgi:hypothetical protein
MIKSCRLVILLTLFIYLPFHSGAWGVLGHRIVAQIAESYLNAKAKAEIQKILGTRSMAIESNWADFIKSDTAYAYLYNWHFINMEQGYTSAQFMDVIARDTAANAYNKLNFLVRELKNKQLAPEKKLLYLRLLIHIAGDLHQPMHVGRLEDKGGNDIKVSWFNTQTNIHALWDEHLINFQQLSYTEYANGINHTSATQRTAWQKEPVSQWIYESYKISEKIYNEIKPEQKLSYRYNFDYIEILNERLLKGGVRLGGLLNELFGK